MHGPQRPAAPIPPTPPRPHWQPQPTPPRGLRFVSSSPQPFPTCGQADPSSTFLPVSPGSTSSPFRPFISAQQPPRFEPESPHDNATRGLGFIPRSPDFFTACGQAFLSSPFLPVSPASCPSPIRSSTKCVRQPPRFEPESPSRPHDLTEEQNGKPGLELLPHPFAASDHFVPASPAAGSPPHPFLPKSPTFSRPNHQPLSFTPTPLGSCASQSPPMQTVEAACLKIARKKHMSEEVLFSWAILVRTLRQ